MDYTAFVRKAKEQDSRNIFEAYTGNLDVVPNELKPFYRACNPVDVELDINDAVVRFCPAVELPEMQQEYSYINAQFVFATSNGDPIFLREGTVYTCAHGMKEPKWEKLSDSFERYIDAVQ